ncbi:hypothetical protein E4U42_006774 [Claviceps africana]|uniref:Uncharacterized protein n=1 Tax=Claviceps africana TaxID=83212 RepID=A0A8K0NGK9_9HYPO|nr:hypothetical protein E4U42_006774 [Claviceps africana]
MLPTASRIPSPVPKPGTVCSSEALPDPFHVPGEHSSGADDRGLTLAPIGLEPIRTTDLTPHGTSTWSQSHQFLRTGRDQTMPEFLDDISPHARIRSGVFLVRMSVTIQIIMDCLARLRISQTSVPEGKNHEKASLST